MSAASVFTGDFSFQLTVGFEEVIENARIVKHRIGRHRANGTLISRLWSMLTAAI